jgi:hypothetical protein
LAGIAGTGSGLTSGFAAARGSAGVSISFGAMTAGVFNSGALGSGLGSGFGSGFGSIIGSGTNSGFKCRVTSGLVCGGCSGASAGAAMESTPAGALATGFIGAGAISPHGSQHPTGPQLGGQAGTQQHARRQLQQFISRFMHRHAQAPSDVASKASVATAKMIPKRRAIIEVL